MKLTYQEGRQARVQDARAVQASFDDAMTATAVREAPTPEEAWDRLAMPVPFDPALRERLTGALDRVFAASDAITKGLEAFGALAPDVDPPPAWVDRMVELHVQELDAYWALDAAAVEGLTADGWTTVQVTVLPDLADPLERLATRARWQAEAVKPGASALWFDKLARRLDHRDEGEVAVRNAGRALVVEATRRRFAGWRARADR